MPREIVRHRFRAAPTHLRHNGGKVRAVLSPRVVDVDDTEPTFVEACANDPVVIGSPTDGDVPTFPSIGRTGSVISIFSAPSPRRSGAQKASSAKSKMASSRCER